MVVIHTAALGVGPINVDAKRNGNRRTENIKLPSAIAVGLPKRSTRIKGHTVRCHAKQPHSKGRSLRSDLGLEYNL